MAQGSITEDILSLIRRIVIVVFTKFLVQLAAPQHSGTPVDQWTLQEDPRGRQSIAMWMVINRFCITSILVVGIAFLSRMSYGMGNSQELNSIMSSIQWVFGDSLGDLLSDQQSKRDFALVGFVVIPHLLTNKHDGDEVPSAVSIWKQGNSIN